MACRLGLVGLETGYHFRGFGPVLRLTLLIFVLAGAQAATPFVPAGPVADPDAAPTIKELLSRLNLDRYKATIKGLTHDR